MRPSINKAIFTLALAAVAAGCSQQVSYEKDVLPILQNRCQSCHDGKGEGSQASGFVLMTYEDLMKGTQYGPVVVEGESLSSTLFLMIDHRVDPKIHMPPHQESDEEGQFASLSRDEIETIKTWIDQGAKNN